MTDLKAFQPSSRARRDATCRHVGCRERCATSFNPHPARGGMRPLVIRRFDAGKQIVSTLIPREAGCDHGLLPQRRYDLLVVSTLIPREAGCDAGVRDA